MSNETLPAGRALIVPQARVVVVRVEAERFRALTAVCPHAGCLLSHVERAQLACPCHGSRVDLTGRVAEGPAERPLAELPARYDAAAGTVTVAMTAR